MSTTSRIFEFEVGPCNCKAGMHASTSIAVLAGVASLRGMDGFTKALSPEILGVPKASWRRWKAGFSRFTLLMRIVFAEEKLRQFHCRAVIGAGVMVWIGAGVSLVVRGWFTGGRAHRTNNLLEKVSDLVELSVKILLHATAIL